jgi:DNA invertase Pin-like site-specific DNA recombinase
MDEMDLVSYKNNDANDLSLKNLYMTTQAEVNSKIRKMPQYRDINAKIKDTEKNIKIIIKLLESNYSYKKIGSLFACSEMSVHRFVKRNQIKEKIKV